nr:hypothetical protein [uncultured Flavobacterium sp.]
MISKLTNIFYVLKNSIFFKLQHVKHGISLRVRGPIKLLIKKDAKLLIGNNFTLVSGLMLNPLGRNLKSFIRIDEKAKITIGNNVGMSCVTLWAKEEIYIGNNVKLGADVFILDSDMHSLDYQLRRSTVTDAKNSISKKIYIGDDVFVGTRSIICKRVGNTVGTLF